MIELRNIQISYSNGKSSFLAVKDVSFDVPQGKRVALLGPSGSGKSTILRCIAGLQEVTSGTIEFLGGSTPKAALAAREFGFVPQEQSIFPWKSAKQNIAMPLELTGVEEKLVDERVTFLLDVMGLGKFAEQYPDQLSGGMRARVAIARALAVNPNLLLLDECLGALDEFTREKIALRLSADWQALKTTVLFITHSVQEAALLADRIIVLSNSPARVAGFVDIRQGHPRSSSYVSSDEYAEIISAARTLLGLDASVASADNPANSPRSGGS